MSDDRTADVARLAEALDPLGKEHNHSEAAADGNRWVFISGATYVPASMLHDRAAALRATS